MADNAETLRAKLKRELSEAVDSIFSDEQLTAFSQQEPLGWDWLVSGCTTHWSRRIASLPKKKTPSSASA